MLHSYPAFACYARRVRKPARSRVLVIAPHPDDDVLGCGGALQRLAAKGARISVVYVTDGSASHVKSKRFPPAVLRDLRENEARSALLALGIRASLRFLRAPDGKLDALDPSGRRALVAAIAHAIGRLRPNLLLAPWQRDPHPDHIATAAIVAAARGECRWRAPSYAYRVWLPVRGTIADEPRADEAASRALVLTAPEVERKRAAILAHRSQTGAVIDDDPDGFRIDATMLAHWLDPVERYFATTIRQAGKLTR